MRIGVLFWILMVVWLLFGLWWQWPSGTGAAAFGPVGGSVLLFLVIGILGWKVFGAPLRD
jgi:hypothetical protein